MMLLFSAVPGAPNLQVGFALVSNTTAVVTTTAVLQSCCTAVVPLCGAVRNDLRLVLRLRYGYELVRITYI